MSTRTQELAERLQRHFSGPMKEEEIHFLRDVQGFIEFAIRNGLSFPMVASHIGNDFNEVMRDSFDLSKAKSRGFAPKVAGYSEITQDAFGGEDSPLE